MKKSILILLIILTSNIFLKADVTTEKEMSKISRDSETYLFADVRSSSEEEAYEEALKQLTDKVTDYFQEEEGENIPDAVYLKNISTQYEKLSSHLSSNRYRVMLYVKKTDLIPIGGKDNAIVLSKNSDNAYQPVATENNESIRIKENDYQESEKTLPQVISSLMLINNGKDFSEKLVELRKNNQIKGAASFPISAINDYYIVVIDNLDKVENILHVENGIFKDIKTGKPVDINQYIKNSAYWFTLQ